MSESFSKRLLWFVKGMVGCSELRPSDRPAWWQKQLDHYEKPWLDYCAMKPDERKITLKDREDQYKEYTEDLKSLTGRVAYFAGFVGVILGGVFFLIKEAPSVMWLAKAALIPIALSWIILLFAAAPSISSIYKQHPTAAEWQELVRSERASYTKLMMRSDRASRRYDALKRHQIRALMCLFVGGILLVVALMLW